MTDHRTEAEVLANSDARRHLRVLREMKAEHHHRAVGFENSVERRHLAGRQHEQSDACDWALLQLDPMLEGPKQIMDEIARVAE